MSSESQLNTFATQKTLSKVLDEEWEKVCEKDRKQVQEAEKGIALEDEGWVDVPWGDWDIVPKSTRLMPSKISWTNGTRQDNTLNGKLYQLRLEFHLRESDPDLDFHLAHFNKRQDICIDKDLEKSIRQLPQQLTDNFPFLTRQPVSRDWWPPPSSEWDEGAWRAELSGFEGEDGLQSL
nr:uncharacterized protein CI109_007403 [Kwoniella shandongensis]KAA5524280.1 hypothetical protein CI109_007403 [Kwoniella shandongensis]